jgi:putative ABC transport system permease protein
MSVAEGPPAPRTLAEAAATPAPPVSAPPADDDPWAVLSSDMPRGKGGRFAVSSPSALEAIKANKGRAVLTMLGIIIGVGSVIVMVALGQGASSQVSSQLAGLGTNVLTVMPGSSQSGGVRGGAGTVSTLTNADVQAIRDAVPGIARLSPIVQGNAQVIAGSQNWQTRVQGVAPEYQQLQNWTVQTGAFFTAQDALDQRNVAVIGQTVARNLFGGTGGQSPIGQSIRIRNAPFTVIGVLGTKGASGFQDQDDVIFVPFQTGQVRLFGAVALNSVQIQVTQEDQMDDVTASVTRLLRSRHRLQPTQADDFNIRSSADIVATAQGVSRTLTLLLGSVAGISLIVGGIGIMNIMLVSVTERTREIGIRMAIGARPGDVLAQFLTEAILLSVLGGLIGVTLGIAIALGLPRVLSWPTTLSMPPVLVAFGFAALVGVFFGYYPARKASRLNPIDALRFD